MIALSILLMISLWRALHRDGSVVQTRLSTIASRSSSWDFSRISAWLSFAVALLGLVLKVLQELSLIPLPWL